MKNVFIIDEYASSKINGIGTYIRELIYCLKEIGASICLISCCHESKLFRIEENDGIKQIQFPVIQGFFGQHYMVLDKFLRLYIKDSTENIFLLNHTPCDHLVKTVKSSFPLSKLAFVIHDMTWTNTMLGNKEDLKKYTLVTNRVLFEKVYPELFPVFNDEKRMYETVHRIVALAPETIELLQSVYGINYQKISLIPNGLQDTFSRLTKKEKSELKARLFVSFREKVIVFAGRVKNVKGIFQVINSLKKITKTYPHFRLVVVGTIFEVKKIMEHAGEIVSKITFTGQLSKEKLNEWYQVADLGILASYWEQCSYTGIEMMMHGLPVIASDGFCVGDMFKDGVNAAVARIGDRNNPEEFENNLSEAFLKLMLSYKLRSKLGENGRKMYESKYQIQYMKNGYLKFFTEL